MMAYKLASKAGNTNPFKRVVNQPTKSLAGYAQRQQGPTMGFGGGNGYSLAGNGQLPTQLPAAPTPAPAPVQTPAPVKLGQDIGFSGIGGLFGGGGAGSGGGIHTSTGNWEPIQTPAKLGQDVGFGGGGGYSLAGNGQLPTQIPAQSQVPIVPIQGDAGGNGLSIGLPPGGLDDGMMFAGGNPNFNEAAASSPFYEKAQAPQAQEQKAAQVPAAPTPAPAPAPAPAPTFDPSNPFQGDPNYNPFKNVVKPPSSGLPSWAGNNQTPTTPTTPTAPAGTTTPTAPASTTPGTSTTPGSGQTATFGGDEKLNTNPYDDVMPLDWNGQVGAGAIKRAINDLPNSPTNTNVETNPYYSLPIPQQELLSYLGKIGLGSMVGIDPNFNMTMPNQPDIGPAQGNPEDINATTRAALGDPRGAEAMALDAALNNLQGGGQFNQTATSGAGAFEQSLNPQGKPGDFVNTEYERMAYDRGAQDINKQFDEMMKYKKEELRQRGIYNTATGAPAQELDEIEQMRQEALGKLRTDISLKSMEDMYSNYFQNENLGLSRGGLGLQGATDLGQLDQSGTALGAGLAGQLGSQRLAQGALGLQGQSMQLGRESELYGRGMNRAQLPYQQELEALQLENALKQDEWNRRLGLAGAAINPSGIMAGQSASNNVSNIASQRAYDAQMYAADQQARATRDNGLTSVFSILGELAPNIFDFLNKPKGGK